MPLSYDEATEQLTGPGGPFEISTEIVGGLLMKNWKTRERSMREKIAHAERRGEAEFMVQGERRLTYGEFAHLVWGTAANLKDRYGFPRRRPPRHPRVQLSGLDHRPLRRRVGRRRGRGAQWMVGTGRSGVRADGLRQPLSRCRRGPLSEGGVAHRGPPRPRDDLLHRRRSAARNRAHWRTHRVPG